MEVIEAAIIVKEPVVEVKSCFDADGNWVESEECKNETVVLPDKCTQVIADGIRVGPVDY